MAVQNWIPFSRQVVHVMRCAVTEWLAHRASSKGAALAFYTLFSLAPILVLVIAIAGFFYGTEAAQGQLLDELRGLVGKQGAETIQAILAGARNKESGKLATIIATVLLLIGATSAFAELKDSLDEIWDVPPPRDATWWDTVRTRLLSFGLILTLGLLLMFTLVVSAALTLLEKYLGGMWHSATIILGWVAWAISFLVIAVMFGAIYKLLPRVKLSWHDVTIGALGTAIMFTVGKFAIGLYIGNSGTASSFGAAGSLIALLLWVYYSAQIFFLGAEFARQYALQMGSLKDKHVPGAPPPEARPSPVH
ncbi:YihY/virulence factor BrkB family protein [Telluria mixta]|uniref:YihY/virulence factor BrkB family protein n=1 Tax=Telluria mixta TaxID=34071 RepID=A0ABT2C6X2_9BURK|nr:YihY/virulence factor BrkB family protein [Telluria mixta]MCS0633142.1 YihY/virulence factor BrkB family protein [Telluria mixta]WEM96046.1 YihY/virulence factor BrkB family protein [Telluria mixta]